MAKAFSQNTARLAIVGDDPMLLSGEDPAKSGPRQQGEPMAYQPRWKRCQFRHQLEHHRYPSASWAEAGVSMTPKMSRSQNSRTRSLRPRASIADGAVAAWEKHNAVRASGPNG